MTQLDVARHAPPSAAAPIEPILVSKQEGARLLGVCVRTVTTLIATKQLPCRRIGRRTLIPYRALLRFAQRN